ncbi:MAG: hypothetical protein IAF94_14555 [Pirellulaceae bacterium]|nr:hypothetical protein [Pirellulaceae bacterium]
MKRLRKTQFIRLGVYNACNETSLKTFGPLFTNSADDLDTIRQVIEGFNLYAAANPEPWCIAAFPASLEGEVLA